MRLARQLSFLAPLLAIWPGLVVVRSLHRDAGTRATARPVVASGGVLETAPAMAHPRAAHTATALGNGLVLVAGGFTTSRDPHGAELFDPVSGRFRALPPMVQTRFSHTATRLPNGQVLLVGGYVEGGTPVAHAELFDPATNRFTATGTPLAARADHIAVLLDDGTVLIAGGLGPGWTFLASAERYDPRTGRFTRTGDMTVPRESHVGVRLRDGHVLVIGGHRGRREQLQLYASTELYDPQRGVFRRAGEMQVARHKHDAVLLRDGRVLVTGGSDARDNEGAFTSTELYDPATGAFTMGPSMRRSRYKHANSAVPLPDGTVLLAGGATEAERYDPASGQFTVVPGVPRMAGQFSASAPLPDGGALITGGYGGGTGPRASAWRYRP